MRGYLIGSGWKDYCKTGRISGVELPPGLELAQRLREPIFTPSTKAPAGQHDENISMEQVKNLIGADLTRQVRDASLQLYTRATEYARERGIIIADTKFEFGLDATGALRVMDEVLTPDSSRFWPADTYKTGSSPPSFDKQYIRDYLETLGWNKQAAGAEAAGRRHRAHAREVCGSATAADERTAGMTAARSQPSEPLTWSSSLGRSSSASGRGVTAWRRLRLRSSPRASLMPSCATSRTAISACGP